MDIATHFFHLFYNENATESSSDLSAIDTQMLATLPTKLQVLLLSAHANNLELYKKSQSFMNLYAACMPQTELSLDSVKLLQNALLTCIDTTALKQMKPHILRLNAAEIITNQHARTLTNFCTQSALEASHAKEEQKVLDLKTLSNELNEILKRIRELQLQDSYYARLQEIYTNAQNHKFSIGITGVLSAGKSTFLNALLGKEVLGSSTIPETANLTVLQYAQTESAEVYFWNEKEWGELKEAGKFDKSLQSFVSESERIFDTRLQNYIAKNSKSENISLDMLQTYTSANHESKLCNLVKEVVLFTNLKFLQNNVSIVDTPGLDDPITKREEITKAYIRQCDLLIHVMNASCVATQIDIDFILESFLEQNISRLLVVLTRIDLIGEKELAQSLEYTKTSLAAQLKKAQYSGDIDSLLARIDFIPVASFLALLHRTNREQEALEKGYPLEKTGILEVENYLDSMLLGENSMKHKDILYLAYRAFLKTMQEAQEEMRLESSLLNATEEELDSLIATLRAENNKLFSHLEHKKSDMSAKQKDLQEFLETHKKSMQKALHKEKEKLQERVREEAIYGYQKGNMPSEKRLQEILETGLYDCFSDVSRDFKYKLAKKMNQILFDIESDTKQPQISFHAPKEHIAKSLQFLLDSLPKIIQSNKGKENELTLKLHEVFNEAFALFNEVLIEKNKEVEGKFVAYFDSILIAQEEEIQHQITQKEELLQNTITKRKEVYTESMREASKKKQKELASIIEELAYITRALQ